MDLPKAFDSVWHAKVIDILTELGIKNEANSWGWPYINYRSLFVELKYLNSFNQMITFKSPSSFVKYGVPQGSILGPLLFYLYIDGLSALFTFNNEVTFNADDINLKISGFFPRDVGVSAFC